MRFLTIPDFYAGVTQRDLDQLIQGDTTILDTCEDIAMAIVRDALYSRYNIEAIFATVPPDRPAQVVRWLTVLAIYFLYERTSDRICPPRVIKNYDDVRKDLTDIEDGKKSTILPLLEQDPDNPDPSNPKTKFRGGSTPPRSL